MFAPSQISIMASIQKIPVEITFEILSYIDSQADLYHLLCTCRHLQACVTPELYRDVRIHSLPGQANQVASDRACLYRLYRLVCVILRKPDLASMVQSFSFEDYCSSDSEAVHELFGPHKEVDPLFLVKVMDRGFLGSDVRLVYEWLEALLNARSADPMLALLLPYLSRVEMLRLIFHTKTTFCDRMLASVIDYPGEIFPRSAFGCLRCVVGDQGTFATSMPLWDNFNLFFAMPSVTSVIGHCQLAGPAWTISKDGYSKSSRPHMTSNVTTIVLGGLQRQSEELTSLTMSCPSLTSLKLKWGHPSIPIKSADLLELMDAAMPAAPSLEKLTIEYRERITMVNSRRYRRAAFAEPLTDFTALKSLKLGMIFIFDLPCLQKRRDRRPLDLARKMGPAFECQLADILPVQLERLVVRRHRSERHVPLLLAIDNVFKQGEKFSALRSVVVESTYRSTHSLSADELRGPYVSLDADQDLLSRGLEIGIEFSSVYRCPK